MRPNSEDCIRQLTPAIVEKCDALAAARKERIQARLFLLLPCGAVSRILGRMYAGK